ncbi:putative IclR family transcriptional regulator [Actinacidiphila reveromycinica]|uniref:Putative IclR family transcriptional regulator n=1 Tax=Actinacidiphila reveromycinica TaxID=659352 RepID=A0A7U3UYZ4_9ACTN|nr:IclR family transcriptional regulator [Streptomyces sp. SN-593]BBB01427.1 putative IclR family transcriptional regulator [Streptomyces sp. SN-593]
MQSVLRSLRVLETVSEHQPIGVGALSRLVGLPTSTVQRILVTLAEAGWLRPTEEEQTRWNLTAKALIVGRRAVGEVGVREAAAEPMAALRDATQETIHLSVLDGLERIVLIDRVDCDQPVRTYNRLGSSGPLHVTAIGRSMLAAMGDADVERVIAHGLERVTENTITDPARLRENIRETRELGYAVNIGENRANVCAVGAPVLGPGRRPVAGIAISMPDIRFDHRKVPHWGDLAVRTAAEISANLTG